MVLGIQGGAARSICTVLASSLCLSLAGCPDRPNGAATTQVAAVGTMDAIDGPDGLSGMPAALTSVDTSPAWDGPGEKLVLRGTVLKADGKTPAADVVLYYYQTNTEGRYQHRPDMPRSMPPNALGQTHGYIRGWVRTGSDGRYEIRTVRPGAYPSGDEAAHIHLTIKEPDLPEYWVDDFVFDDDPLLTSQKRQRLENRAGSGVLRLERQGDLLVGERDLILGQNIPNHPRPPAGPASGRNVGEDVLSFIPFHAWGPDKGSRACPICKYGDRPGILFFVGNTPDWEEISAWLTFLEAESIARGPSLKAYFVYGNESNYSEPARRRELESLGARLNLQQVALTFVPSLADRESDVALNRIDPKVRNTFLIYSRSRVVDNAVDLKPDAQAFQRIRETLDRVSKQPGGN